MIPERINLSDAQPRRTVREMIEADHQAAEHAWDEWWNDWGQPLATTLDTNMLDGEVKATLKHVFVDAHIMGQSEAPIQATPPQTPHVCSKCRPGRLPDIDHTLGE